MDRCHPSFDPKLSKKFGNVIRKFYMKVDKSIGELINATVEDTNVIVVSDHGMGPQYGCFLMNNLLREKGLLILKRDLDGLSTLMRPRDKALKVGISMAKKFPVIKKLAVKILPFQWKENFTLRGRVKIDSEKLLSAIDWHRTRAYALGEAGGIFVRNKSDCWFVRNLLKKIKCPYGKRKCTVKVYEKHQIYNGPYIDIAPDILCLIDGYNIKTDLTLSGELWSPPILSGYHTEYGLFIAAGPDIESVTSPQHYSIYDVLPTILMLFEMDIPSDLDGGPLRSLLRA